MEEMQIWNLFQSARIAGALSAIGIILAIWLALRVAAATRASDESNIITKLLSTVFCGTVVLSAWTGFAQNVTSWALTARSLEDLQASGTEISETATGFCVGQEQSNYFFRMDFLLQFFDLLGGNG